jgi:uncharacterized membrane protein
MNYKLYALFIVLYLVLDMIWLQGGRKLHLAAFNKVTGQNVDNIKIDMVAGFIFYLIAPLAYFVYIKPLAKGDPKQAFMLGSLMGLLLYGTYDLTSKAIYSDRYEWSYAIKDILWGTLLFGVLSYIVTRIEA